MKPVTVIDYGAGNLLNVVRALEHIGAEVEVTKTPAPLEKADRLILPGVGAFGDCMKALGELGLIKPLTDYIQSGRLFLGICVGMQVMFEVGEEFGEHRGLGIIKGKVSRIAATGTNGAPHKVPHIGWGPLLRPPHHASWKGTMLESLESAKDLSAMYFVHSYMGVLSDENDRLANVDYDGIAICAAVKRGNAYGCQFHPEKSGETGLNVLRGFINHP